MKSLINKMMFVVLSSLVFLSCQKDELQSVLDVSATPTLTASASNIVLQQANGDQEAITFTWSATNYGFKAATSYTLQMAKKGTDFTAASSTEIPLANNTQTTFTITGFNRELLKIISAGSASEVEVRIKSEVGTMATVSPVYSNVVTITATPYRDIINYPSLYVPGDYQGWDAANAPKISSKTNNKVYEGYINIKAGSLAFKITSEPDWNHTNYGDGGTGKLSTSGGDLKVPSAGYYLLNADLNSLTWSATKIDSWGVIGDAMGSWDVDKKLSFNSTTEVWTLTTDLSVGKIKFRANDAWDLNFGDSNIDNIPEYSGGDIPITAAGNYTITLDLSVAGNYNYSIKRN